MLLTNTSTHSSTTPHADSTTAVPSSASTISSPSSPSVHSHSSPSSSSVSSHSSKSCNVRLIDFGNAMTGAEASLYYDDFDVQTLYYRAPEVLLGVGFSAPIDMWSLGCVLMELSTGKPLFHCVSNQQLFSLMVRTLGPLPIHPYRGGKFAPQYLTSNEFTYDNRPVATQHVRVGGGGMGGLGTSQVNSSGYYHLYRMNNIAKLLSSRDRDYVSFILGLLEYDPAARLTPTQALFHPFFGKLFPLSLLFHDSSSVGQAVATVTRLNSKQSPHLQQQQQVQQQLPPPQQTDAQWTFHPSLLGAARPLIIPSSAATVNVPPNAVLGRSPYLPSGRTLMDTAGTSMLASASAYPLSPLTTTAFSLQASPALFPVPTTDVAPLTHLVHPQLLTAAGLTSDAQMQQLLSPSANGQLLSLPALPTLSTFAPLSVPTMLTAAPSSMETYYPTALSSFYNLNHPATPILTARPPPVVPRFPGSPDLLYPQLHTLTTGGGASASPQAQVAYLHCPQLSTYTTLYSTASTAAVASPSPNATYRSLQHSQLAAQQQALVESSLAFTTQQHLQTHTPLHTARKLAVTPATTITASTASTSNSTPGSGSHRASRRRNTRVSDEKEDPDSSWDDDGGRGGGVRKRTKDDDHADGEDEEKHSERNGVSSRRKQRLSSNSDTALNDSDSLIHSVSVVAAMQQHAVAQAQAEEMLGPHSGIPPSVLARIGVPLAYR